MNNDYMDQEALKKYNMIAPLITSDNDPQKQISLRKKAAEDNGVSVRTIRRYEAAYRKKGFSALRPKPRKGYMTSLLPENYGDLLKEAIILKQEVPRRSAQQIIYILETEGKVPHGVMKRSTLQRYLYKAGFGIKQMKKYNEDQKSTVKRFCKPHRMMLVQTDIKYGTGILYTEDGKKKTAYLSSIIDDHSRFVLSSEWYESQDEYAVTDVFRKAIQKYGVFDKCYTDNGSQYVSEQLKISCAMLGIRLVRAKPYSGKSKGKVEKFHQIVDDFIAEIRLKKIRNLAEINQYWNIYLEGYYHKKPHEGIREYYESQGVTISAEGITPLQEWNRDTRPLVYREASEVAAAFQSHTTRKVDRGGCINFNGRKYETSASLIGMKVTVSYDPADITEIMVSAEGIEPLKCRAAVIGSYCDPDPAVPVAMQRKEPETSRLLDAIVKNHERDRKKLTDAIIYGNYEQEED